MSTVLLVKTSSLGDVIHNLPVVSDICAKLPDAQVDWVVEDAFAAIPRLHPGVRSVIPVAVRRWRRSPLARATWEEISAVKHALRDHRYDCVLDTQGLIKSGFISRLARGRHCGYAAAAAREPLAARFYDDTFAIPKSAHAVERNRRLAAAALGYSVDMPLKYGISAARLDAAWLPAPPYSVLLTATSRKEKMWPDIHWLALANDLNLNGLPCVLPAGTEAERTRARMLEQNMRRAVAAPRLDLAALAGLLAGAALVVGLDTGLTHFAAALGVAVVAVFAGSDPQLTGVYAGAHALNLGGPANPPTPQEVIAAAHALIG